MKSIYLFSFAVCLFATKAFCQKSIVDESIRYQQERMVYKQWDRSKFKPGSGFLGLSPYYWLTWGLHPNYPDTDRRPLSAWGPQTQRLGMVGTMNSISNDYRLDADTLRNTSLMEINNQWSALSSADPLWLIYYSKELRPVLEHSSQSILAPLSVAVRNRVIAERIYDWYANELNMLKERIDGARNANMDRGSRILAYHRILLEYKTLASTWATRTASASSNMKNTEVQTQVKSGQVSVPGWSTASDANLAREIVRNRKF